MERVIANIFTTASNYLSSDSWSSSPKQEEPSEEKERTTSEASATSSCSRASTSSTSSRKAQKVFGWLVFGSKKVLSKKSSRSSVIDEQHMCHKKTALDVLLATNEKNYDRINPHELKALSVIGRGGYGRVLLLKSSDGKLCAVKQVPKQMLLDKPTTTRSVRPVSTKTEHAEFESLVLHQASSHSFITSFHGSFQTRDSIFLSMEYVPGGELFSLMQKQGIFSEQRTRIYAAEITSALEFLHGLGIIYRDLKPENILLDREGHIRLADFGLSIQFQKPEGKDDLMRCVSICGTPEYICPEIILLATTKKSDPHASYGKGCDWWALGILTYEMLFRVPPFYSKCRKTMLNKILGCKLEFPSDPKYVVTDEAIDFISQLLKYDEKDRLGSGSAGSKNVKSHPFFGGLDFKKVERKEIQPEYRPVVSSEGDVQNFDSSFTRELVKPEPSTPCLYNIEVNGYEYLENFDESVWYTSEEKLENN